MKKLRFYISPYFIVRGPLLRDIKKVVNSFNFKGRVLDIGCGNMPYKGLFKNSEYLGIDFKNFSKNTDFNDSEPDYYFDENYQKELTLPFKNGEFDNLVAFQVLEHHRNPEIFFSEAFRVLKPKGMLLFSFPFIEGIHEEPNDFQRFTKYGIERILNDNKFEVKKIYYQGKFFSVLYFLISELLNHLASKNKFYYFVVSVFYLFVFLPIQYLSILLDYLIKTDAFVINYLVVASKK